MFFAFFFILLFIINMKTFEWEIVWFLKGEKEWKKRTQLQIVMEDEKYNWFKVKQLLAYNNEDIYNKVKKGMKVSFTEMWIKNPDTWKRNNFTTDITLK